MDALFTGNLLYKCKSQGMTLKLNNRFENNIIADVIAPRGVYLKIVEGPMTGQATNGTSSIRRWQTAPSSLNRAAEREESARIAEVGSLLA